MKSVLRHPIRFVVHLAAFLYVVVGGPLHFFFCYHLTGRGRTRRGRSEWMQFWGRVSTWACHCKIDRRGCPLAGGLYVANHLSYVDIFVLAGMQPTVFVSKADVANWPVFGLLAKHGGTLFLKRESRNDVARIAQELEGPIRDGLAVVMFLEGTSSGGDTVLPFRSSLLDPAARSGWPVTPLWIGYAMDPSQGTVRDDIAYWRDMTLVPHMFNLLTKTNITAQVAIGEPLIASDRKELALVLQERVCELALEFGRTVKPEPAAKKL